MKPLYVRVVLFDPLTEETFPVEEGIRLWVGRLDGETRRVDLDRLPLAWDDASRCFAVHAPEYRTSRAHRIVVRFERRNFSKAERRLLSIEEAEARDGPFWAPARLPDWDTGWDHNYRRNRHFGLRGRQHPSSPERPILLRVPIRRLYVVGHRGAPHHFPENTIASFGRALDLGANGIEFDLCLLKDGRIAVFHDAQPTRQPPRVDRTLFEKLPYELASPRFSLNGMTATFYAPREGTMAEVGEQRLRSRGDLDLVHLSFEETRDAYRYPPVRGEEHRLVDLDTFLAWASGESDRLAFLFFDVKPPGALSDGRPARDYGRRIGEALRRQERLPERLVIGYADTKVLHALRHGILSTGETRCWFAYDAAGGLSPLLSGLARGWSFLPGFLRRLLGKLLPGVPNPLRVARRMHNRVVSIGTLARPAHMSEIRQAVRDRDYRPHSSVEMVVHWTLNDREQFAQSFEAGVNAILTDKPDDLVAYLAERGVTAR